MIYGQKLLDDLKERIDSTKSLMRDRQRRISEGLTDMDDCFVSERMNQHTISELRMKINILENGGISEFEVLVDIETNEVVSKRTVNGKFGMCWLISEQYQDKFGVFVGIAKRQSTYEKRGLRKEYRNYPAWVTFKANGTGMAGAYTGCSTIFQSDVNYWTGEKI